MKSKLKTTGHIGEHRDLLEPGRELRSFEMCFALSEAGFTQLSAISPTRPTPLCDQARDSCNTARRQI